MNRVGYFIFCICAFSCGSADQSVNEPANQNAEIKRLESKVDSLSKMVNELSAEPEITNEAPITSEIKPGTPSVETKKTLSEPIPKKKVSDVKVAANDTVRYYYKNSNKISVIISPWKEGRRNILLFDPWGKETYRHEDALLSYSNISEIKSFHTNGAVYEMTESLNPGGGIQHYESLITFGINNDPEWKTVNEYPPTLENMTNNQWYWSKKEKTWIKQEVIIETITPE